MKSNKNIFLYLAIAIPALMMGVVMLSVYFFQTNLQPNYKFLYTLLNRNQYSCKNEIIAKLTSNKNISPTCSSIQLYVYDFQKNDGRAVSMDQAQQMKLINPKQATSPDGFSIQGYCSTQAEIGWWGQITPSEVCVKKDKYQKSLRIKEMNNEEYHYFDFIGWIYE